MSTDKAEMYFTEKELGKKNEKKKDIWTETGISKSSCSQWPLCYEIHKVKFYNYKFLHRSLISHGG